MYNYEIPSKALYDMYCESNNANYSYELIVTTVTEANKINAELEKAEQAVWQQFEQRYGEVDILRMSDDKDQVYTKLSALCNENYGVVATGLLKGRELVPVKRIQKQIASTKKHIQKLNSFFS